MSDHHPEHAEHSSGHVVTVRTLATVLVALLVLTWVTVAATFVNLGTFNMWIALTIACIKGSLVVLYFMHLRWDRPVNALFFIGSLLFVAIFVGLALMDTVHYQEELIRGYAPALQP